MKRKIISNPFKKSIFKGYLLLFLALISSQLFLSWKQPEYIVKSPNNNLSVQLFIENGNKLFYSVKYKDSVVIQKSNLGIKLNKPEYNFTSGLSISSKKYTLINEKYTLTTGKKVVCNNNANQLKLKVTNDKGHECFIVFRAYNDGIAYRYELTNKNVDFISSENSSFAFDKGTIAWAMNFRPDHEGFYKKQLIDTMKNNSAEGTYDYPLFAMPLLLKTTQNKWILLHESNVLDTHNPASSLIKNKDNSFSILSKYPKYNTTDKNNLQLFEKNLVKESSDIIAYSHHMSPWRVMIIGSSLKPIVESTLIENLCPNPPKDNYSWIKPGVTAFPWWGNNFVNGDPTALKNYIDLASEMNWKFIEFDVSLIGSPTYAIDEWKKTDWVKSIVNYANSKGVSVYGWDERRNLDTAEKRADIFSRYKSLGIKGIKIDFINSVKQEAMEFRQSCLKDAMKYELLVSFHGDYTPRGERRTYPNLVTNEGVKGSEFYLFGNPAEMPTPVHNTTLPFTRNVIGPMDYTPVAFSTPERITTYAHELALSVIFESGWVGMCDKPEIYRNSPAFDFLKKLVSVWDETVFLTGFPAEYYCVARRSGANWYVAGNNAGTERTVSLNLNFLSSKNKFVKLYCDGENARESCDVKEILVSKDTSIKIKMAKNGGFAFYVQGD